MIRRMNRGSVTHSAANTDVLSHGRSGLRVENAFISSVGVPAVRIPVAVLFQRFAKRMLSDDLYMQILDRALSGAD